MAKNIIITVNAKSSSVQLNTDILGVVGENLQGNFIVDFVGENFVQGSCWLETDLGAEKGYISLEASDERTYKAPIKSGVLKQYGTVEMQVRITQTAVADDIPIFKSDTFKLTVLPSINAMDEIPDEYPEWIDIANERLAQLDNYVPQRLSIFKETSGFRQQAYIYADDGKQGFRMSMESVKDLNTKIVCADSLETVDGEKITKDDYIYVKK